MTAKHRHTNTNLLESIGMEILKADPTERLADTSLKIEHIPTELIRPDPVQPRRVLPEQIHVAFHANRLTPAQALRELMQVAQIAARQNGRPFTSVLELLPNEQASDDETEGTVLSPEERLVRDLVNLAVTIREDGQVNPLTVVDVTQGVTRLYRIETGERRYWAAWIVRDFLPDYEGDGTVPCLIIPSGKASAFRQAKENTARSGLSAIAMARQAALLVLAVHGVSRPDGPVTHDFYQQALQFDLRSKREFTAAILTAMGGLTKSQFSRYKALLQLSEEATELGDRYNLDEFRLRYVLNLSPQDQVEMIRQIIQFNLSGKQIQELTEHRDDDNGADEETLPRPILQLAKLTRIAHATSATELAQAVLRQEKDIHLARARLQALKQIIADAEQCLSQE